MSAMPKLNISSEKAFNLINSGERLNNMFISGKLDFSEFYADSFDKDFEADNCTFEYLRATCAQFSKSVKLTNCELKKCEFNMTWFFGGLIIDNCIFENYLSFESGGHNQNDKVVSITNSTFKKFVNFIDNWYNSYVVIANNNFEGGTNLLGKPNGIAITFDVNPRIENNNGQLDINDEGDLESSSVYLEPERRVTIVQQLPEFIAGGQDGLKKLIKENIKYPEAAFWDKIGGEVVVKFTVDEIGNVTDVEIDKGVRKDLDDEAMRVIRLLNGWEPGMQNEKKVKVVYKMAIRFSPNKK
jgi:TonB family protein